MTEQILEAWRINNRINLRQAPRAGRPHLRHLRRTRPRHPWGRPPGLLATHRTVDSPGERGRPGHPHLQARSRAHPGSRRRGRPAVRRLDPRLAAPQLTPCSSGGATPPTAAEAFPLSFGRRPRNLRQPGLGGSQRAALATVGDIAKEGLVARRIGAVATPVPADADEESMGSGGGLVNAANAGSPAESRAGFGHGSSREMGCQAASGH